MTVRELIAEARRAIAQPAYYHVELWYLFHDRAAEPSLGRRCPCCGSFRAEIVERRLRDRFLITRTGVHKPRSQVADLARFDAIAEAVPTLRIELQVPVWEDDEGTRPLDVLEDIETPIWLLGGGGRGGKTHWNCIVLTHRWLYRGGPGAEFAAIAPKMDQAHLILRKLVKGEAKGGRRLPPILPPELVTRYPANTRSVDQNIELYDGSQIWLTHTKSDGHFHGHSFVDATWTEAHACAHEETYNVVRTRLIDTGGQLFLDSTPAANYDHWLRTAVVAAVEDEDRRERLGEEKRKKGEEGEVLERLHRKITFHSSKNVWVDPKVVERTRASIASKDPAAAKRLVDGIWTKSDTIFGEQFDEEFHVVDCPGGDLGFLGLTDITRKVTQAAFGRPLDWIGGVDVNWKPHTVVLGKVFGEYSRPDTWGVYWHRSVRTWSAYADESATRTAEHEDRKYRKRTALVIDANASRNEKHHSRGSSTPIKDYKRAGFVCEPNLTRKRKPQNPDSRDASALMRLLMLGEHGDRRRFLVNREEDQLITALETQADRGDGYPDKMPNTQADREIHCFVECCRYAIWKLFQRAEYGTKQRKAAQFE